MKENLKRKRGITLIALVITIVILLILAGITIASLNGNNGLFARAKQARQNTLDAQKKENVTLEGYEDTVDYVLGTEIKGIDTEKTNPEGAMPSGATVIQGEMSEGIVIRDENDNEWVWVEVPRTEEVYPTVGVKLDVNNITDEQCNTIYEDLANYASVYRADGFEDIFYSTEQHGFKDADAYNEAKNNMLRSVYKYGGFWIGRYEVGDADATASNTTRTKDTGISNKAVIQINQIPYNYVTCKEAQELSNGLSTGGKTSSLMFGIQWDLTCKFLEKSGLAISQINGDSINWGNYTNSAIFLSRGKYNTNPSDSSSNWLNIIQGEKNSRMLLTTGASEDTNKMNIYDFAGNEEEWTLEKSINNAQGICVRRGADYIDYSYTYPGNTRYGGTVIRKSDDVTFRASLY